jgi:hypothetical protein
MKVPDTMHAREPARLPRGTWDGRWSRVLTRRGPSRRPRSPRPDEKVQVGIRAINRRIAHDFERYWSLGAELRLEGHSGDSKPDKLGLPDLRGDAVIYLWEPIGDFIRGESCEAP